MADGSQQLLRSDSRYIERKGFSMNFNLASWARGVVCFLVSLAFSASVGGQTIISGDIVADTHWTLDLSPIVLNGDVRLLDSAQLVIDPGVVVYMGQDASFLIEAGKVQALGTQEQPIRVLSDKVRIGQSATAGDWKQWVFAPGSGATRLDYVELDAGQGIAVYGAAPVLNHLKLTNHLGPAISIDLSASPSGVGIQAAGNGLNGILVPSGDLVSTIKWGLRGIPYVVQEGVLSVGMSPRVSSIEPQVIERGQNLNLTLHGSRLTGLAAAQFDRADLDAAPQQAGSSDQLATITVQANENSGLGSAALRLQFEAGEVQIANALTVIQPQSGITEISPSPLFAGSSGVSLRVAGRNFNSQSEILLNDAPVVTTYVGNAELRATLPGPLVAGSLAVQVRSPDELNPGQYIHSNVMTLPVHEVNAPTVALEPSPLVLPPDGLARVVTVRLSRPSAFDYTLDLTVADLTVATIAPGSLTIPAGQTAGQVTVTPVAEGAATLVVRSPMLDEQRIPLHVTSDYQGALSYYAKPVGVDVGASTARTILDGTLVSQAVGVVVGNVAVGQSSYDGTLPAPVVGVVVGNAAVGQSSYDGTLAASAVGVVVGDAVVGQGSYDGMLSAPAVGVDVGP